MDRKQWSAGSDNVVEVDALKDVVADSFLNSAVIQAVIKDLDGNEVDNSSVTLDYVASSDGKYRKAIESTALLTAGRAYVLEISGSEGSINFQRKFMLDVQYAS